MQGCTKLIDMTVWLQSISSKVKAASNQKTIRDMQGHKKTYWHDPLAVKSFSNITQRELRAPLRGLLGELSEYQAKTLRPH